VIKYKSHGLYILLNHHEIFHSNASLYEMVKTTDYGTYILNDFILMGKRAVCMSCESEFDIEHLDTHTLGIMNVLAEHFFAHKYDNNFFIFDKTSGNRFCFTCFFLIIS